MPIALPTLNPLLLGAIEQRTQAGAGPGALARTEETAEELAVRAGAGSLEAFEELVARHEARIYGFLRRHLGNDHDAQDITQETFVRAWRGIHRFDPGRDFAAWLFVIARRTAANHFRARRRHEDLPEDLPAPTGEPALASDESAALWSAARRLKPKFYEALWLRYGEGFSVAETAQVMGLTVIHLKVILHRARKELAAKFKPENL